MRNNPRIMVFGASSAICHALMRRYASEGAVFFLAGRNQEKLEVVADDLRVRGGNPVGQCSYDFNDASQHERALQQARESLGEIDLFVVAHGTLPDQAECEASSAATAACIDSNFTSTATIMQACAQQLMQQGSGTLAVLSSVAGDRGRKSNYTYGASKAGVDAFLQGLQGRFSATPVKIVNIKPGMIVSPMTADMEHGAIWSTPEKVAPAIQRAIAKGRAVAYVPGYWRLIMLVIRLLPTSIMARLPI